MLILLPPSEGKAAPSRRGRPLDLATLSFPALTERREAVLDALAAASSRDDAPRLLGVGATLATEVERNTRLRRLPARPTIEVYTGVLYAALDWPNLPPAAKRRGARRLLVASALFGLLRPADRIPPYRLSMDVALPGTGPLATFWQPALAPVAAEAAADGVIVDCRSQAYAKAWRPRGELAERTAAVRVWRDGPEGRTAVGHLAKHTRGEIARDLVLRGTAPRTVPDLVEAISSRWDVEPTAPRRAGHPWVLDVLAH